MGVFIVDLLPTSFLVVMLQYGFGWGGCCCVEFDPAKWPCCCPRMCQGERTGAVPMSAGGRGGDFVERG